MQLSHRIEHVFKLIVSKAKDVRNIDQVMADIAEGHQERDYHRLFLLLKDQEIFIPVNADSLPEGSQVGDVYQADLMDQHDNFRLLGSNDQALIPIALNITCAILKDGFLKLSWIDFITLICSKKDIDGATLEGESSWVKLSTDRLHGLL